MADVTKCLTDGGIPDQWTRANLAWLAEQHTRMAGDTFRRDPTRSNWHGRWAALITDILESPHGQHQRV